MNPSLINQAVIDSFLVKASEAGLQLIQVLAIFIIGRWLIKLIRNVVIGRLQHRKLDPTIVGYAGSTITGALNVALMIAIVGKLGVDTTSFAALIAGAGLAIGAAWSGMLANFAAGVFVVFLRPFKVGDLISGGGAIGRVTEIGLFSTTINTEDNVLTHVGNSKLLASNLKNFSANSYRRLELHGTLRHSSNLQKTMEEIKARMLKVPNVLSEPAPEVVVRSFDELGCTLMVHPCTHNDNFLQVQTDAVVALLGILDSAGPSLAQLREEGEEAEAEEGMEGEELEGGKEGEEAAEAGEKAAEGASKEEAE
jgi:small conductance mechanosensitive channel